MSVSELKIAFVQADLKWEDADANLQYFESELGKMEASVDVVVLPEMFTTGFSMHPEKLAEMMDGKSVRWMRKMATKLDSAICGSVIIKENNNFYNRFLFVEPDGKISTYDKRHLFTLAGEHKKYTAGLGKIVIDFRGFRICPMICYDLRFPAFARNQEDYDALLYPANWPIARIFAWETLLRARAIENMCYVVGVNRIGNDGSDTAHNGQSAVIDFLGQPMVEAGNSAGLFTATLLKTELISAKRKFGFLNDRDQITVT